MEPKPQTRHRWYGPQPRRYGLPHGVHTLAPALALRPRQVTARADAIAAAARSVFRFRVATLRTRRQEICLTMLEQ